MTFSVAGFCQKTGQYGVAVSSSSICVASRCAFISPSHGAVLTQNVTNPVLGQIGAEALKLGKDAQSVLNEMLEAEAYPEWRQLIVLDSQGQSATHSGSETLGTHNTAKGQNCVAGGNMLANPEVVEAMVSAFEQHDELELAERLLAAMDAGLAAGGEMGPVFSAGLLVSDKASWPVVDLRVDWHIAPLVELRMIWQAYKPQRDAYICRADKPDQSPGYGVPGDKR